MEAIIFLRLQSHISNKLIPLASYFILNLASSLGTMFIMCLIVNLTKEDSMDLRCECLEEPGAPEVPVDRKDGLHLLQDFPLGLSLLLCFLQTILNSSGKHLYSIYSSSYLYTRPATPTLGFISSIVSKHLLKCKESKSRSSPHM